MSVSFETESFIGQKRASSCLNVGPSFRRSSEEERRDEMICSLTEFRGAAFFAALHYANASFEKGVISHTDRSCLVAREGDLWRIPSNEAWHSFVGTSLLFATSLPAIATFS